MTSATIWGRWPHPRNDGSKGRWHALVSRMDVQVNGAGPVLPGVLTACTKVRLQPAEMHKGKPPIDDKVCPVCQKLEDMRTGPMATIEHSIPDYPDITLPAILAPEREREPAPVGCNCGAGTCNTPEIVKARQRRELAARAGFDAYLAKQKGAVAS